eukprot:scaffold20355_cov31-Tisochrysis_lutea.AAC.3
MPGGGGRQPRRPGSSTVARHQMMMACTQHALGRPTSGASGEDAAARWEFNRIAHPQPTDQRFPRRAAAHPAFPPRVR